MKVSKGKSARAQRKSRHYGRRRTVASLNLTSLMDIFTILVFFLLVSQAESQFTPDDPEIILPESSAETTPDEMLTIEVSGREIRMDGRLIATVDQALDNGQDDIPELVEALQNAARKALFAAEDEEREAMLIGDQKLPYALIEKIMFSANQTPYTRISFAVLRRAEEEG